MTVPSGSFQTFQAVGNREDLSDIISIVEREETPLLSSIGSDTASATTVEWQTQALAAASTSNAMIQGDAFANKTVTPSVRLNNKTQIFEKTYQVTETQKAVKSAGRPNELGFQRMLSMKEIKRDQEAMYFSNTASTAGNASTAPKLGGLESWATSNVSRGTGGSNGGFSGGNTTTATDGTQREFTEDLFKSVLKTGYDNGARFKKAFMGSFNKQKASAFAGNATRTISAGSKLNANITVYESDFGVIDFVLSPHQRARTVFLVDPGMLKKCNLRNLKTEKLAKTADSEQEAMVMENTLKVMNEKAIGVVADLTTS